MTDIIRIAKGVYRNMAVVAAEFFDIPWLTKERIRERVEVEGLEYCEEALKKKRGLLMVGAHFGNWELQAIAFSLLFRPVLFLYRPLDNLFLDRLVTCGQILKRQHPPDKEQGHEKDAPHSQGQRDYRSPH